MAPRLLWRPASPSGSPRRPWTPSAAGHHREQRGYTWDSVIQKMTDEQWDAILDVHLKAPFRILRAAQPIISGLVKRAAASGGPVPCCKVVNISSMAGLGGNAGQANYAAAKAGVIGLTKTLAKEWGRYNVTVNTVAFGLINTRLTKVPAGGDATISVQGRTRPTQQKAGSLLPGRGERMRNAGAGRRDVPTSIPRPWRSPWPKIL